MSIHSLIKVALNTSLFPQTTLPRAFHQLAFIQADPIQSPARAQDLILRHRVKNYKNGDLEKHYKELEIEEDFLYAHGFMTNDVWRLLHPRPTTRLSMLDKKVLEVVQKDGEMYPKDIAKYFDNKKVTNWWGGTSHATSMALERLHYYGFIKIIGRNKGLRRYAYLPRQEQSLSSDERAQKLILAVVNILQPVAFPTLKQSLFRIRRFFGPTQKHIDHLLKTGILTKQKIDGLEYIFSHHTQPTTHDSQLTTNNLQQVKFLAPFDPIVWDRLRFEHLWGWPYRFEAYVPASKRIRGYYAMPLLWDTEVIGWANVAKNGDVVLGYTNKEPTNARYKEALGKEIQAMKRFLGL